MRKPVYISELALYIINQVRHWRLELGLDQRVFQIILKLNKDGNILGAIESNFYPDKYNDKHLNNIAIAFTSRAKDLGITKVFSLSDFYPDSPLEEKMVKKIVIEVPKTLGQTGILTFLLIEKKDPFFNSWHSTTEIALHCGAFANMEWKNNDFTFPIKTIIKNGYLERKSETEALYRSVQ